MPQKTWDVSMLKTAQLSLHDDVCCFMQGYDEWRVLIFGHSLRTVFAFICKGNIQDQNCIVNLLLDSKFLFFKEFSKHENKKQK